MNHFMEYRVEYIQPNVIPSYIDNDLEHESKTIVCYNIKIIELFSVNGILTKNGEKTLMNNIKQSVKCISNVELLGRILKIKNNEFYEYSDIIPIKIDEDDDLEYCDHGCYQELDTFKLVNQKRTFKIKNPYYKRK